MNKFCLNSWSRTGLAAATALLLHACAPNQDTPTPTAGVDLSRYLAVGDSYTAGYSAGGLTRASQEYSFPNLLAQQFSKATPNAVFTQPLLEVGTGAGYLDLVDFPANGFPRARRVAGQAVRRTVIDPAACGGPDTLRLLTRSATSNALPQNLGVPGLLLSQIETVGWGNEASATPGRAFNPYFERLLPANDNRTYLQAVTTAAASATFFTYFQGLDDLMPYVRSGGQCGEINLDDPVKRGSFQTTLRQNAKTVLDQLTSGGRRGIVARVPDLVTLPILRSGKGSALETRLQAIFGDTARLYIADPNNSGPAQRITGADYVVATTFPRIGQRTPVVVGGTTLMLPYGRDSRNPLRDADVLDSRELSFLTNIISNYNNQLNLLARDVYKLPVLNNSQLSYLLDINSAMPAFVVEAISVGGVVYTAEPVRGNFFSLDYYSLTPRGNALIANTFILAINKAYRANIPAIDANSLPTAAH
ncbi:MAG: hypothetical protein JWR44_984 [Hymenobacter sp.]|jgi:hypothetical protein|nr:hypothetical protein [Hymenobacter sp.]